MHWKLSIIVLFALFALESEAVRCYFCSNLKDPHKYCENAVIHHMPIAQCPEGRCIYYDFRRGLCLKLFFFNNSVILLKFFFLVYIAQQVINRTCLEFENQCLTLRDSPGNSLRQCVVCSWDLCNNAEKFKYSSLLLVLTILFRML